MGHARMQSTGGYIYSQCSNKKVIGRQEIYVLEGPTVNTVSLRSKTTTLVYNKCIHVWFVYFSIFVDLTTFDSTPLLLLLCNDQFAPSAIYD